MGTNRREHSQTALPERSGNDSALVAAASSAVCLQGRGKDCQGADEAGSGAICACARYGADPGTPNDPVPRQAAAVSVAPGCLTS